MPHSLRTERLVIRPITLRDARVYWFTHNNPDFARMTGSWAYPFTELEVIDRIHDTMQAGSEEKQWFSFIEGNSFAGTGVLFDWQPGSVEIGYSISPEHTGRGLAREGAGALCDFLFKAFRLKSIRAKVSVDNPASLRILEKLGFSLNPVAEMGWVRHYNKETPFYRHELIRERFRP